MASTSSKTIQHKYDVFLSFRGPDTRNGFVNHLYDAFCRSQIDAFIDNRLDEGEDITSALLKTIEKCCVSVVIFSDNFAHSRWCLDELTKIAECKETMGQIVLPVFYKIDPSHVQELTGSFGDAFDKHKKAYKLHTVKRWRRAVVEIANLKGWDSQIIKIETKLIEEIVNDILKKLSLMTSKDFDDNGLVGITTRRRELESLLRINGSEGVSSVGIWGMGGAGKTTLAASIFERICTQFEGHYFCANVREESEKYGLIRLRDEIISKLLGQENINMLPNYIKIRLQRKKILIVFDDVSSSEQLKTLVGEHSLYGRGSRIIVTSRDLQVLNNECDATYKLKSLTYRECFQLFMLHAFKQNEPTDSHLELTKKVINYAKGNPLALKILGSNLYGKGIREWESELAKLEGTPNMEIQRLLRISYDGLDWSEKEIFLDIACCLKGLDKDSVERILDGCGFCATSGIRNLCDKSLINISKNRIEMHDLLQQLGRNIDRQERRRGDENRGRFWNHKEFVRLLKGEMSAETVESISLDMSKIGCMELSPTAFARMHKLRLLRVHNPSSDEITLHLPQGLESFPNQLRLLYWDRYPLKSLPSNFCPENLVELHLCHSQVQWLWYGIQLHCKNLKRIDLSYSINLIQLPKCDEVPNLEDLYLQRCIRLVEVTSSLPDKLVNLVLDGCKSLSILPSCLHLTSLQVLSLQDCPRITDFPNVPPSTKKLFLCGTAIAEVASSLIEHLSQLEVLDLRSCKRLTRLPPNIGSLKCLKMFLLGDCVKLYFLPGSICKLTSLEDLDLKCCINLHRLPQKLGDLKSLERLCITRSGIKKLPSSIGHLSKLKILSCGGCESLILPRLTGLSSLVQLDLHECGLLKTPSGLGRLESLSFLYLEGSNFEIMPKSFKLLSALRALILRNCKRLQCLPELPKSIVYLDACNCTSLRKTSSYSREGYNYTRIMSLINEDDYNPLALQVTNFGNCFNLEEQACVEIIAGAIYYLTFIFVPQRLNKGGSNGDGLEPSDGGSDSEEEFNGEQYVVGISCCIPGSEIPPGLCDYQSKGSSLVISQEDFANIEFDGCAFCAVIDCKDAYDTRGFDIRCDCHFTTKSGRCIKLHCNFFSNGTHMDEGTAVFLQSKHIFISYETNFFYESVQSGFTKALFQFYPVDRNGNRMHNSCEVIECGVWIITAE